MLRVFSENGHTGASAEGSTLEIIADMCAIVETVMDALYRKHDWIGMKLLEEGLRDKDMWEILYKHIANRNPEDWEFITEDIKDEEDKDEEASE